MDIDKLYELANRLKYIDDIYPNEYVILKQELEHKSIPELESIIHEFECRRNIKISSAIDKIREIVSKTVLISYQN